MKTKVGIILIAFCLMAPSELMAQQKRSKREKMYPSYSTPRPKQGDQFLQTQWWLGFRAGANLTQAMPTTRYSGFSPINYDARQIEKRYDSYNLTGGQAGLEITFYHRGFSFSLQPNYRRQRFSYGNEFMWQDTENADNSLELKYEQDNQLDYVEFPLLLKYDLTRGKLRPFVQAGVYYATLSNANKSIEVTGTDYASGGAGPFDTEQSVIGAKDLFIKSSWGIAAGGGASFDFWNVRLIMDITYRRGMNNITNVRNRYTKNKLAGIGDALDDMTLNNISFNFGFLFPLRFINKQFDAN